MDRKSLALIVVSLLVLFGVWWGADLIYPPVPRPHPSAAATNQQPAQVAQSSNAPAPGPVGATTAAMVQPTAPEHTLTVSNQDVLLHFTSHGGGLKLIELKDYKAVAARTPLSTNAQASLNTGANVPVFAILGGESVEGDNDYTLTQNKDVVRAEKSLPNGLRIVKEFQIGSNYLFTAKVRLENPSSKPVTLPPHRVVVGTASATGPTDDPTLIGVYWYNGSKREDISQPYFANRTLGCFPGTPRTEYEGGANNVVWAAVHNQFFTLAAIPATNAPQVYIRETTVLPPSGITTNSKTASLTNGYQAAFAYPSAVIEPGKSLEQSYTIYAGPKEYNALAKIAQQMNNNLDLIMGFPSFFGFFSKLLLLLMNAVHSVGIHYGIAIILITISIKLLFWPLTTASTRSMKRMQSLQPQMKAIAEKYKDDPAKKNQKTMEFMKEHKVNPLGGCLPMLLQIPVFIGFYWMLRSAIELRGVSFLWAWDLSQPDTILSLGGFPINPLPLLMTATMIWQTGLTPASPGMDPGQQKFMRWGMPILMLFFFYNMAAGLTLYWTVQNLLTIAQTKLTKTTDETAAPGAKPGSAAPIKKK